MKTVLPFCGAAVRNKKVFNRSTAALRRIFDESASQKPYV